MLEESVGVQYLRDRSIHLQIAFTKLPKGFEMAALVSSC